ncbi:hypothetical protein APASM_0029 [Actinosynnema pretiosum subsp. pretiosum]|nr:hypothetical protein APASM_0029 [Actinosynnema pretiosum subsp. pretiosum]
MCLCVPVAGRSQGSASPGRQHRRAEFGEPVNDRSPTR